MWTRVDRDVFSLLKVIEKWLEFGAVRETERHPNGGNSMNKGWRNKGPANGLADNMGHSGVPCGGSK